MLTIHPIETKNNVIVSKKEFKKIIKVLQKIEEVRILINEDPDYLTEEELEQLKIAEEEFKNRETISFVDLRDTKKFFD
jgi:hypothetical protein